MNDLFGPAPKRLARCTGCGGTDGGHFVNCALMREEETEKMVKKNGICLTCNLVKPCDC